MKRISIITTALLFLFGVGIAYAADIVPNEIQQPGTQPQEVSNLESPNKCDNCHGGYNSAVEPAYNWRGSMMANAGRDPIFWATLAAAEQDFDGAGDLCIRCHSTAGWLGGRSTPTDGSALAAGDADGVECDFCHKVTNPDNSEFLGVQNFPFIANDGGSPAIGYYGSGMASIWAGSEKLGPYSDAAARHQFMQSKFHRSVDFCGTCHDVSNPAVGDLAHNNGAQTPLTGGSFSGVPGAPVETKAAFNNFPYQYGIVERTFSEYKSGLVSQTLVDDYVNLPSDLKGGALKAIYEDASINGTKSANYEDGDPRYYSCQSCHMRPIAGLGCNKKGAPIRADLPLHDMTGGNYWMPEAIKYLDSQGKLRLGGGLTATQIAAIDDGALRAQQQLDLAASLTVSGNEVKVINHTGHKLISGYPEGRRIWLNVKWYDSANNLLREDGEYGQLAVLIDGVLTQANTILDLHDPNTKIYEAHYGMTKEWADQLIGLGYSPAIPLSFDRETGAADYTLGDLAAAPPGTVHETFHFVLNNVVAKDNRIPPYGMSYDQARVRNALPVPADQYGNPGAGGTYNYWDEITLNPPAGASFATIDLLYQPTSWEYIQFLYLSNILPQGAFLAGEGVYMLEAWQNTGMAEPYVMASATWGTPVGECNAPVPTLLSATPGNSQVSLTWQEIPADPVLVDGYKLYYDQAGKAQLVTDIQGQPSNSYTDTDLTNGQEYCYKITSYYVDGSITCESDFSNILCAIPTNPGQTLSAGVDAMETGKWVKQGKGKNATTTFEVTSAFTAGDAVVIQAHVVNEDIVALPNATVEITIKDQSGAVITTLLSGQSNADGWAEATWQTQKPHKRGSGGTPSGVYSAVTTNVTASGYVWNGVSTSTTFCIDNASCGQ